jgi:uncharacterized protein (UPF0333 family)
MGGLIMNIINDDAAQTSAEMLLLFGGIIVVVIVAALYYRTYLSGLGTTINQTDTQQVVSSINNTSNPKSLINKIS